MNGNGNPKTLVVAVAVAVAVGKVMPQFKGRAEGGTINAIAREELLKPGKT